MMKKVVYITGGTKGIGFGMAEKLVEAGYGVAISGRSLDTAKKAAAKIGKEDEIIGYTSDIRKLESEKKAVAKIEDHIGRLDVMVANAGLGDFDYIRDLIPQD